MAVITSTAVAQNSSTVLTIPFYGYDQQSIVGSVVATSADVSTIALACAPGTDGTDCGLFPYETLTIGPSTYNIYMSDDQFTGTQMCDTAGGVCTESAAGASANFPGVSTTTYAANETANIPVTITAGAALLAGSAPATTTSGGSMSSGSIASSGSGSGAVTTSSASMTGSAASGSGNTGSITGSVTGSAIAPSGTSGAEALTAGLMGLSAGLLALLL